MKANTKGAHEYFLRNCYEGCKSPPKRDNNWCEKSRIGTIHIMLTECVAP